MLFSRWIDGVLDCLKIEAAGVYVAGVRKARQEFIALLGLTALMLLALSGFVFIHVALFVWLPWSLPTKALVLLILGVVYLSGGLVVFFGLTSHRAWMKFTGVDCILASLPPRR